MTNPRIEATARELKRLFSEGETSPDSMWLSCAKCVLDASDAVAWRHSWAAPDNTRIILGHPDYVTTGYKYSSWRRPEWIGLFFSDVSPGKPISPQPTHWQPLPKPPTRI